MTNIRSKRSKPGLRQQHLKALQAAAQISGGQLKGASIGASEFEFKPGGVVRGGKFTWNIGTAGSCIMLALCVLPLGLFADSSSTYRITGGLFQDFAPSAFHLKHVLIPILKKMGADVEIRILKPGYVPKGQGIIEIHINPVGETLCPIQLMQQGRIKAVKGLSLSSNLKNRKVSERMAAECIRVLKSEGLSPEVKILNDIKEKPAFEQASIQAGAALTVWAVTDTGCRIGADMAGAFKRPAENIGENVARQLIEDIETGAVTDRHLADQLIPFAALADGISEYRIPKITSHVESRIWLVQKILGAEARAENCSVKVKGIGFRK